MSPGPQAPPLVIRNDAALFQWGFTAAWLLGLALITYVAFRDVLAGGPVTFRYMPLILAAFWAGGIGFACLAFRRKRIRLEIGGGRVRLVRRGPVAASTWEGPPSDVLAVRLEEDTDSDGDPYFRCVLTIPGPETLIVAEGGRRAEVEARLDEVLQALGRAPRT